ncbi:YheC/YheD family protein [Polycladomyces sp. WAk]|uniref:YheC/YheD family protein n=1 Tax=Polycladomyces zharkentensis TaxID=2807616 RepID=A0ABS2WHH9_9BACL|nr:YheC/YheD family protein [Polycladomyces sp. WAk]MBN2908973.1 YheC/YheD family protein [Polycladomyces sp. WAk]
MGQHRVQIQIVPNRYFPPQMNMVISRHLAQKLHLEHYTIWTAFGSAAGTGLVALTQTQSPLIRISASLAHHLHLTQSLSTNARYDPKGRVLRFGPILGILINQDVQATEMDQPFGSMTRFLEECILAGKNRGVVVTVLRPEEILLKDKTVRGWIYEQNQWQKALLPLPDVVYNRITSRRIEAKPQLQKKIQRLRNLHHISIFNERFLDKQQVYDILKQDPKIRTMLPETYPFSPNILRIMLMKYPCLYLKPTNGSLGNGIFRVTNHGGVITCQYTSATRNLTQTLRSVPVAVKWLQQRIRRSPYIIQQGLTLVRKDGRPIDFRVLVQKNIRGEWAVTSTVGRVANDQDIVSNLARGGTLHKAGEVLLNLHVPHKPTLAQLRAKAIQIAQTFERLADGHYAELGIDLALDIQGKLWLLEINSKPSKTDDTVTNPTLTTRPSVSRLIDYTCHLCGLVSAAEGRRKIKRTPQTKPVRRKSR